MMMMPPCGVREWDETSSRKEDLKSSSVGMGLSFRVEKVVSFYGAHNAFVVALYICSGKALLKVEWNSRFGIGNFYI